MGQFSVETYSAPGSHLSGNQHTKGTDAVAADDPTTYASIQTFADGIQSMGDARAKIALAIMHSAVFT